MRHIGNHRISHLISIRVSDQIKTESAIAKKLFEYISIFGSPYYILSDMGKEFDADVVSDEITSCEAIEDHHPIQQRAQNSQHTIDDTILVPGTTVYLKVEGTLGKLDSRYRGPYKIHKQVNLLVAILKTIYPRHKIKDEIEDDHVESLKDSGPS